jgi:short-subunit dehydrogenase
MEYMGTGLTVSVVFPGAMATNIFQNSPLISAAAKKAQAASTGNSAHKSTPADVAAKIIIDGMQAKKMKILVGKDAKMQDLFARLMPVGYTKMFYKQMKGYLPKKK